MPFARVGAVLPGIFKIKRAKLRGVESFGMLCSAKELELSEESDGLHELPVDAPAGKTLNEYLNLDDHIIEIDLTPNRGDCLNIRGIAREISTRNSTAMIEPMVAAAKTSHKDTFPVEICIRQLLCTVLWPGNSWHRYQCHHTTVDGREITPLRSAFNLALC